MGVDVADVNGDGLPDLVVTNFNDQYHSLFMGSRRSPTRTELSPLTWHSFPKRMLAGERSSLITTTTGTPTNHCQRPHQPVD